MLREGLEILANSDLGDCFRPSFFGWRRSADRTRLQANSLLTGNFAILKLREPLSWLKSTAPQGLIAQFPKKINRETFSKKREEVNWIRELFGKRDHIRIAPRRVAPSSQVCRRQPGSRRIFPS
jgi:hypothetical protein